LSFRFEGSQLCRRRRLDVASVADIDVALADVGQRLGHAVGDLGRVAQHRDDADLAPVPCDAVVAELGGRGSVGVKDVLQPVLVNGRVDAPDELVGLVVEADDEEPFPARLGRGQGEDVADELGLISLGGQVQLALELDVGRLPLGQQARAAGRPPAAGVRSGPARSPARSRHRSGTPR
jgi:hypothetical protein